MTSKLDLKLKVRKINGWSVHALEFENDNSSLIVLVPGKPANIQTKSGRDKRLRWQSDIAKKILEKREEQRNPKNNFAISIGFKFPSQLNNKQPIDIDNYIKPIFAGIACGLFVENVEKIPSDPEKFRDFDDSNFNYLYVERLVPKLGEEGIVIVASQKPG